MSRKKLDANKHRSTDNVDSGRADWLWMDENGQVTTYINQRGNDKSLKPSWLSAGVTHGGMGTKGRGRQYVFFGRLYDSGRQDVSNMGIYKMKKDTGTWLT